MGGQPQTIDRREAILDAALDLFAERGFHGTAVPLVAERAGVGAGTVYRYFESKEALVNALFRRWKTTLSEHLIARFPLDAPAREQFRVMWERLFSFADEYPKALDFIELHHHADYLDEESRCLDDAVLQPIRAFVEHAQAQQILKPVMPDLLLAIAWGAFLGIQREARARHLELTAELRRASEECVWEAIRR